MSSRHLCALALHAVLATAILPAFLSFRCCWPCLLIRSRTVFFWGGGAGGLGVQSAFIFLLWSWRERERLPRKQPDGHPLRMFQNWLGFIIIHKEYSGTVAPRWLTATCCFPTPSPIRLHLFLSYCVCLPLKLTRQTTDSRGRLPSKKHQQLVYLRWVKMIQSSWHDDSLMLVFFFCFFFVCCLSLFFGEVSSFFLSLRKEKKKK